ncbi:MAG: dihydrodipicolinate reductase [Thaumarchaeota archaeon]|nr:MAG: dihydrodipicolinate reductase [Nitrososphaerota archaeon]
MRDAIKVILYGVGEIGRSIAKALLKRRRYDVVGAIDVREEIIGRDLGEILGLEERLNVMISDKSTEVLESVDADIVVLATTSYLKQTYPQIMECLDNSLNVISTCEELSYPWIKYPKLSDELDKKARKHGVTVLGTGINPGFLMDTLPIVLTSPCLSIKSIRVKRIMYSGNRRIQYQKKIGTGLSIEEFKAKIRRREITGHVGLFESVALIASTLGWKLDEIVETPPEPVIAERDVETTYTVVKKGRVAGLRCEAYGLMNEEKVIKLEFVSHACVEDPFDEISIVGEPNVRVRAIGGIHGDLGTVAMILNMIPEVVSARPGLLTMKDFIHIHAKAG